MWSPDEAKRFINVALSRYHPDKIAKLFRQVEEQVDAINREEVDMVVERAMSLSNGVSEYLSRLKRVRGSFGPNSSFCGEAKVCEEAHVESRGR